MDTRERQLILDVGGDPTSADWYWLMCRGPHGPELTWGASRRGPAGFVSIELLRRVVGEQAAEDAGFVDRMRDITRQATASDDAGLLRRALQVLAVIGTVNDVSLLQGFIEHPSNSVSRDARAALFELERVTLRGHGAP